MAAQLNDLMTAVMPSWSPELFSWLLYAAAGLAVLFILSWVRRSSLQRQLAQMDEAGQALASILDELASSEMRPDAGEANTGEAAAAASPKVPDQAAADSAERTGGGISRRFCGSAGRRRQRAESAQGFVDRAQERTGQLDESIAQEQSKIAKVDGSEFHAGRA